MLKPLVAGALGAAVMYFLDPDQGRRRRHMTRDRIAATFRGGLRGLSRAGRAAGAEVYGAVRTVTHLQQEDPFPPNDATLAKKVESEVFRDPEVPKGRINLNVEGGVVVLRGELDRPEQISAVEQAARRVAGVREVENLLHLPGTPARMS